MPRPGARARGYGTAWTKARAGFLRSHPYCAWCAEEGRQVRAEHVHHSTPHKGDQAVFWDKTKWVGLCASHHNKTAQQIERRGFHDAVGPDGMPLDRAHPFYAE